MTHDSSKDHSGREQNPITTAPERSFQERRFHPKRQSLVGRSLSYFMDDYSIQMAACDHRGKRRHLITVENHPIPVSCVHEEQRQHFATTAVDAFERRFSRPFMWRTAVVSGRETAFRTFQMPGLSGQELASAVAFEATKQVPFPVEDTIVDFRKISATSGGSVSRLRINLHAATERIVGRILHHFRTSRLPVQSVHHSHDVLGQLLQYVPGYDEDENYALIFLGRGYAEIAFYQGITLEFLHTSPIDSSLVPDEGDPIGLKYLAAFLSSEVHSSMDYYAGQLAQSATGRLFCYGEMASNELLIEMITRDTGFSIDPFPIASLPFVDNANATLAHEALASLPLVASATCQLEMPSLLTTAEKASTSQKKADLHGKSLIAVVTAVLLGVWGLQTQEQWKHEESLNLLLNEIERFKMSESYVTYQQLKSRIAGNESFFSQLRQAPGLIGFNLKALSHLTPGTIHLYNYEFNPLDPGKNLLLQGTVYSDGVPPEVLLADYVESLSHSTFYREVVVSRWTKRHLQDGFEIDFALSMRGLS
ncbi:MAG: hypothetical protein AAB305_01855 [Candidatus Zixiibacteriota bacterium]